MITSSMERNARPPSTFSSIAERTQGRRRFFLTRAHVGDISSYRQQQQQRWNEIVNNTTSTKTLLLFCVIPIPHSACKIIPLPYIRLESKSLLSRKQAFHSSRQKSVASRRIFCSCSRNSVVSVVLSFSFCVYGTKCQKTTTKFINTLMKMGIPSKRMVMTWNGMETKILKHRLCNTAKSVGDTRRIAVERASPREWILLFFRAIERCGIVFQHLALKLSHSFFLQCLNFWFSFLSCLPCSLCFWIFIRSSFILHVHLIPLRYFIDD